MSFRRGDRIRGEGLGGACGRSGLRCIDIDICLLILQCTIHVSFFYNYLRVAIICSKVTLQLSRPWDLLDLLDLAFVIATTLLGTCGDSEFHLDPDWRTKTEDIGRDIRSFARRGTKAMMAVADAFFSTQRKQGVYYSEGEMDADICYDDA